MYGLVIFLFCVWGGNALANDSYETINSNAHLITILNRDRFEDLTAEGRDKAYVTRIKLSKKMALDVPGNTKGAFKPKIDLDGRSYNEFGIFSGIIWQTEWQLYSRRSQIPLWYSINQALTEEPYFYWYTYRKEGLVNQNVRNFCANNLYVKKHQFSSALETLAPLQRVDNCIAWVNYFVAVDSSRSSGTYQVYPRNGKSFIEDPQALQALLWTAHTSSIIRALWEFKNQFEAYRSKSPQEFNLWGNWLELVIFLENINFPTTNFASQPLSKYTMPQCSPVGTTFCYFGKAKLYTEAIDPRLWPAISFVDSMTGYQNASIDRIFKLYKSANKNADAYKSVPLQKRRRLAAALRVIAKSIIQSGDDKSFVEVLLELEEALEKPK